MAHPSQPNYLNAFSGTNQGVNDNGHYTFPVSAGNLAAQLTAAGKSWRIYAQNFPENCFDGDDMTGGVDGPGLPGQYVRKHNPAISFESVRLDPVLCANIQPLANFDPTVNFAFVVPNMTNGMHDGTTAQGDAFLQAFVPMVTASPDWAHTLLIVSFDEGSTSINGGGHIYTAAAAPWLAHADVDRFYDHFSVLRTIEKVYGLPFLGSAATATTMTELLPQAPTPTPTSTPAPTPTPSPTPTATVPTSTPTPTPFFVRLLWEGFDAVTAPALPAGWGVSSTAGPANCTPTGTCAMGADWATSNAASQTAPNAAFHNAPGCVTDSSLTTPSFFIPATSVFPTTIGFWHKYDLEAGRDGGVLEMSIDGGVFVDIVAAGGSTNYNGTIATGFLSPIAGRQAWTGSTGGYINTQASLPLSARGHNVVLRFRLATDCSGAGTGWYVDSIEINYFNDVHPTPSPPPPTPTATATATATATSTPPQPTPTITPGQCNYVFLNESFDGVTAPALPSGWSSSFTPGPANCTPTGTCAFGTDWTTSATDPHTPPNCAFHDAPGCVTDSSLYSPLFFNAITGSNLFFEQRYDLQDGLDGAVLEISINGGPFTDFVAAGGSFFGGSGYNGTISTGTQSPIAGRAAWTGNSGGRRSVFANMPPAAGNKAVVLRFRLATDCSGAGAGWRVDTIGVSFFAPCPSPTPSPSPTATGTPTPATPTPTLTPTPSPTATHFEVIAPSTVGMFQAFNFTVRALDQSNNTVTGYAGTIHFTSTSEGNLPPDSTLTNGFGTFNANLQTKGNHTITATDTLAPSITGTSNNILVISDIVTPPPVTPTPTLTPTPPPTPATPTPSPTVVPSPTPTPTGTPAAQALNLSTRMRVLTGDKVGIGGFIITGGAPKHLLLRAIGPSLAQFGVPGALADPVLELHGPTGFVTVINDNWREDPVQEAAIIATGIPPPSNLESAIDATLNPAAYTAVLRGKDNSVGVALIEVYDLSQAVAAKLANISTRAFVATGDNIVIAGFMLGGNSGEDRIVVRGIGPSLLLVTPALADPTLELRDGNGALLVFNNDWQDDPAQAAELIAAGLAPNFPAEAAIATTLPPGPYTALLAGLNKGTGHGLVEIYDRGAP